MFLGERCGTWAIVKNVYNSCMFLNACTYIPPESKPCLQFCFSPLPTFPFQLRLRPS